jgi:pimeloyl-ACP methyl ester carboxylesterase
MTHGWPGSVIELLDSIGPLTDPTAHGGSAEDAFHLVLPSIPGYGFSAEPTELGWGPWRVAQAWGQLMTRLGYTRYVAQGGDVGSQITDSMGRQAPEGLLGIHTNLLSPALGGSPMPGDTDDEKAALAAIAIFKATGFGYFLEQATRPETIGYALLDSPIALAAWMLDHDTDSYYKIAGAFVEGKPSGNLTRDHILDNITVYWLTGTGASAARSYWEGGQKPAGSQTPPEIKIPVGFTTFPGEIWRTPRSWVETSYHNVVYFNEGQRGAGTSRPGRAGALFAGLRPRSDHLRNQVVMSTTVETTTGSGLPPDPATEVDDLRRRAGRDALARQRETVGDASQGGAVGEAQETRRLLGNRHDWRKAERKLNTLPPVLTVEGWTSTSSTHGRVTTTPCR